MQEDLPGEALWRSHELARVSAGDLLETMEGGSQVGYRDRQYIRGPRRYNLPVGHGVMPFRFP